MDAVDGMDNVDSHLHEPSCSFAPAQIDLKPTFVLQLFRTTTRSPK